MKIDLIKNSKEESWDLIEIEGIVSSEGKEDALLARFYDSNALTPSPLGLLLLQVLSKEGKE